MKTRFTPVLVSFLASTFLLHSSVSSQQSRQSRPGPSEKERDAETEKLLLQKTSGDRQRRESSPERRLGDIEFRSIDGRDNNIRNTQWGSADIALLRYAISDYADGISEPSGESRLSAREISNLVAAQSVSIPNARNMSSMVWQWGQFVDHDIDLTEAHEPLEAFFIPVPVGDLFFDPANSGAASIFLFRSHYEPGSGIVSPREQVNFITAWIDGSQVYGSDEETAASLREFVGGLMKTSSGNLLPQDDTGFFAAGDIRANEQVGLTSLHTLFVREHNRIATRLADGSPSLNDQELYLLARREVVSILQAITYEEFLPALLGGDSMPNYRGYDPSVNPGIANEFSTSAYRLGHSMLNTHLLRMDDTGQTLSGGDLRLRDAFFNPQHILNDGIEPYLKGLIVQAAQELDNFVVDDVRNFLFGEVGSGGFDLAALNIQRGRDHGLCDYNTMRLEYGQPLLDDFSEITKDSLLQLALAEAYDQDIDNIDSWVGLLAEDHQRGSSVGPTMKRILVQQFAAIRDGDRFWYERNLSSEDLRRVRETKLSDVIKRNTGLRNIQRNVFFVGEQGNHDSSRRRKR